MSRGVHAQRSTHNSRTGLDNCLHGHLTSCLSTQISGGVFSPPNHLRTHCRRPPCPWRALWIVWDCFTNEWCAEGALCVLGQMLLDWKFCRPRRLLEYHLDQLHLQMNSRMKCQMQCIELRTACFHSRILAMNVLITSSAWMSIPIAPAGAPVSLHRVVITHQCSDQPGLTLLMAEHHT